MSAIFLFYLAFMLSARESISEICRGAHCLTGQDWRRPCVGPHCQGRTERAVASRRQFHHSAQSRQVHQSYQQDGHFAHQAQSTPLSPYTIIQPQQSGFTQQAGTDGTRRTNPRTITAEVFHPGCAGGTCPTTISQRPTNDDSAPRECKGIGCKLPLRMRQKAQGGEDGKGNPVHVTDRAAQFLDEFPDFGSERGAWIQLTCDMKPGQYQTVHV